VIRLRLYLIKEGADYEGVRIKIEVTLGSIRQKIIIDIGFGDKVTPKPYKLKYPVLLDNNIPLIYAYNNESIIAEKIEAICKLGFLTSRMKDFYDILFLFDNYKIDKTILQKAIDSTFKNRETDKKLFQSLLKDELWVEHEKMPLTCEL